MYRPLLLVLLFLAPIRGLASDCSDVETFDKYLSARISSYLEVKYEWQERRTKAFLACHQSSADQEGSSFDKDFTEALRSAIVSVSYGALYNLITVSKSLQISHSGEANTFIKLAEAMLKKALWPTPIAVNIPAVTDTPRLDEALSED